MRSFLATLQQLTAPMGAGPNSPAISFGRRVPAALAAHYSPSTVVACLQLRRNSGTYTYIALVNPTLGPPYTAMGGVESVSGIVREAFRVRPGFGSVTTTFGALGDSVVSVDAAGGSVAIDTGAPLSIDGVSAPRSLVAWAGSGANTGAIGTGFTPVLTSSSGTFRAGRAFELAVGGFVVCSAATNVAEFAVNFDDGAETALWYPGAFGPSPASPGIAATAQTVIANTSGSDKVGTIKVYLRASAAGTVDWRGVNPLSGAPNLRYVMARDIGAATDYPNAIAIP